MRNQPNGLNRTDALRCHALRNMLPEGQRVALTYIKRNGETSASTGEVLFHNGEDGTDKMSVTLDTPEKGRATTVNLVGILSVDGFAVRD